MKVWGAVMSLILLTLEAGAASGSLGFGSDERIVGTYYFYWYDWNTSLHFYVGGKDALTHHPPDIRDVSYASVAWHKGQLRDMMEAGIDFVLPVFWDDRTNRFWSVKGLRKLVEAEKDLVAQGLHPPKIGMFFDTTALMVEYRHSGHPGDRPNLSTQEGKELFYGMIYDFYSEVPSELWARIDGSAIVWLYSSGWVKDYDQSLVSYVRERFAEDFNSTIFIVKERSWNLNADMEYGWGGALGPILLDVSAIGPGFDNEGAVRCYGQHPLRRDRLDGIAYREDWERALRSGSNIVVIETWNELHEGTEICETEELGRLYIDITANYSRAFKEGTWNRSLKELDSLILFTPDTLLGSPGEVVPLNITLVNRGWRSWPDHLDLGLFWLNLDSREHSRNDLIRLNFSKRLLQGERYMKNLRVKLPDYPGRYRVIVSTSYLNKRPEISAVVVEPLAAYVFCLLPALSLIRRATHPLRYGGS